MKKIMYSIIVVVEMLSVMYFIVCVASMHAGTFTSNFNKAFIVSGIVSLLLAVPSVKCCEWLDEQGK